MLSMWLDLAEGGSHKPVIPTAASSGILLSTWFHHWPALPSASGLSQYMVCISLMTALLGLDMIGLYARYSPSRPRFLLLPNGCPADAARYSMSAYISATCSTNNCALR